MVFPTQVLTLAVTILSMLSSALATEPSTRSPKSAGFDVIIKGGTVYDGTGAQPRHVDLAICGDRIAGAGDFKTAKAKTSIDATALADGPGFINMLSCCNAALLQHGPPQSQSR